MSSITDILGKPAEEFENDPEIETAWVMKATQHMEIYYNLITSADPGLLRLTKYDSEIYDEFRKDFPDLQVDLIAEETLKSKDAKEKWRNYCEKFKHVDDYNYGTILRLNSSGEYTNENTTFVPRIQFYAIEIARNKEGCNDCLSRGTTEGGTNEKQDTVNDLLQTTINMVEKYSQQKGFIVSVKQESGSNLDLTFFIKKSPDMQNSIQEFASALKTASQNWPAPFADCITYESNLRKVDIALNRHTVIRWCLNSVKRNWRTFGQSSNAKTLAGLVLIHGKDELRSTLLGQLLRNLLEANGYKTRIAKAEELGEDSDYDWEGIIDDSYDSVTSCSDTKAGDELKSRVACDADGIRSNVKLQKINSVPVKEGLAYSDVFVRATKVAHLSETQFNEPGTVYHVVSHANSFKAQQLIQLWNKLASKNNKIIRHSILVYGPVLHGQEVANYEKHFSIMLEAVNASACLKYGFEILESAKWKKRSIILAETALRCAILSVSPASKVSLGSDPRMGCFVQYNCARTAALLDRCPDNIKKVILSEDNLDFDTSEVTTVGNAQIVPLDC